MKECPICYTVRERKVPYRLRDCCPDCEANQALDNKWVEVCLYYRIFTMMRFYLWGFPFLVIPSFLFQGSLYHFILNVIVYLLVSGFMLKFRYRQIKEALEQFMDELTVIKFAGPEYGNRNLKNERSRMPNL